MKYFLLTLLVVAAFSSAFAHLTGNGQALKTAASSAAQLYGKNCASCHGRDGRAKTLKGKLRHARDLTDADWQGRVSDERIFNSIINGKGKMPAYEKKLSEQEIDALVAYVRALKK